MSMKVALFAILALFATVNGQAAIELVSQSSLLPACTTSQGCSIVSVVVGGATNILLGGSLDFSAYTNNVVINFDTLPVSIFGAITTGAGNTLNFGAGVLSSITVSSLTVSSSGVVNIQSGTLTSSTDVNANGAIIIANGAVLNVNSAAGTITQTAGSITVAAGGSVQAAVTVASGASATIGASAAAGVAAASVSGAVIINGVANFGSAAFARAVTVGSSATASAAANIAVTVTATSIFASTFTASAQSTVTVNAGAAIVAAGTVQSQGAVAVAGAINTTTAAANYVQQASASGSGNVASNLQLNGGSVNVVAGANIQIDGSLGGQGRLTGNLTGSGSLNIGNSPGTVFVNGDYRPGATASFNLEVASANSYDQLIVSGTAALNGNLVCTLLNNYGPADNTRFPFITANQVSGQYITVRGTGSNVLKWTQSATASQVIANYNSAVSVAVSGLLVVACLLASLL